jgi:acyl carrier protein
MNATTTSKEDGMSAVPFGFPELKRILVDRVGLPETAIPEDTATTFGELGLDSLARVEVVLAIQQDHDIPVPDDAAQLFTTLQDPIDYIALRHAGMVPDAAH